MLPPDEYSPDKEARKFGTDTPHEPTDEFVRNAFAIGARRLWPDSRDPGWWVTFNRWLAKHDDEKMAAIDFALRQSAFSELTEGFTAFRVKMAKAWDASAKQAYELGYLYEDGYADMLDRNPYRDT